MKLSLLDLSDMFSNSEDDLVLVDEELMKYPVGSKERVALQALANDIESTMQSIEKVQEME